MHVTWDSAEPRKAGFVSTLPVCDPMRPCRCVKQLPRLLGRVGRPRTFVLDSNSAVQPAEFLLQSIDLPEAHPDYLQVVSKQHFIKKFGEHPPLLRVFSPVDRTLRRIAVVLPLHLKNGSDVIPIPFLIDTGSPSCMYLGTGAVIRLRDAKVISEISGLHAFLLRGKLCRGEQFIEDPPASLLPLQFEELSIRGDPRLNLLGLSGLESLKMISIA